MGILLSLSGALSQGATWAVMALGVYITYRILDYADLTADGALSLGGSVWGIMIINSFNPIISLIISTAAGAIAGAVTGLINTKFKIPAILSGILTMISLYSINIRIMGQANISLLKKGNLFSGLQKFISSPQDSITASVFKQNTATFIIGILICIIIVSTLYWFFGTELGSVIRATGNNEHMVRAIGVNPDTMKIIGLMIGNGLVALSGALIAQNQGYADINMGTGAIVIGLASVIIGEVVIKKNRCFALTLSSVVIGSILYRTIIAIVLQLGMSPGDLKLITALIVTAALSIPNIKKSKRIPSINKGDSR